MSERFYRELKRQYRPLLEQENGRRTTPQELERANELCERIHRAQEESEPNDYARLYYTAEWFINHVGILPPKMKRRVTLDYAAALGLTEVKSLLEAAAVIVAQRETERQAPYSDEELPDIMTTVMKEIYPGKSALYLAKKGEDGSGYVGRFDRKKESSYGIQ